MITRQQINKESGNIFVYILIAIALFGALSFTVSRSNRGNTSTFNDQQAKIAAQEIIEYSQTIANAVQKLRLRGCTDTEISFENNIETGYTNGNAPTDNSCDVFHINGGGANYSNTLGAWLITGNLKVADIGSSTTNLNLLLPGLQQNICEFINQNLGTSEPATIDTYSGTVSKFTGVAASYTAATSPIIGDTATDYAGRTAFCFQKASNDYEYIQVLIAR